MKSEHVRLQRLLACLGDPSRFRVVVALMEKERCVTEIAGELELSQSCTTRHLQTLTREGIVVGQRSGKRVLFRLAADCPGLGRLLACFEDQALLDASRTPSLVGLHRERPDSVPDRGIRAAAAPRPSRPLSDEPVPAEPPRAQGVRDEIEDFLL